MILNRCFLVTVTICCALGFTDSVLAKPQTLTATDVQKISICYDLKWQKCLKFSRLKDKADLEYFGPFGTSAKGQISSKEMTAALTQVFPLVVQRAPAAQSKGCDSPRQVQITADAKVINLVSCAEDSKNAKEFYKWAATQIDKTKAKP